MSSISAQKKPTTKKENPCKGPYKSVYKKIYEGIQAWCSQNPSYKIKELDEKYIIEGGQAILFEGSKEQEPVFFKAGECYVTGEEWHLRIIHDNSDKNYMYNGFNINFTFRKKDYCIRCIVLKKFDLCLYTLKVEPQECPKIIVSILKELQIVHNANFVHRDISPGNIVGWQNDYKLIDFGCSRSIEGPEVPMGIQDPKTGTALFKSYSFQKTGFYCYKDDIESLALSIWYTECNKPVILDSKEPKEMLEKKKTILNTPNIPYYASFLINYSRSIPDNKKVDFNALITAIQQHYNL